MTILNKTISDQEDTEAAALCEVHKDEGWKAAHGQGDAERLARLGILL